MSPYSEDGCFAVWELSRLVSMDEMKFPFLELDQSYVCAVARLVVALTSPFLPPFYTAAPLAPSSFTVSAFSSR